ncbi:uncharacterized protein MONBRDRAFT_39358 [Monosiga brevicollis MX1]|uniref:Glycosyl transferase family 25 domain-containing protein n=1 Tax=Monosiga brevicollis TaxID=81824 RepID=A9VE18_MONBE|nr:uncharacterized protein MONBRDRAFT_39358 [Monosiga brevicollis MX1]EDQ84246.1 predicted protein [Monosiga brevicollis MX1]|eukprot:XP_001750970.1 hypothetical protein [Monosiga brevicollis MX1]
MRSGGVGWVRGMWLLLAWVGWVAGSELSAQGHNEALCPNNTVVETVTQCAKASDSFLACVAARGGGNAVQCDCILKHDDVQACIGPCLPNVYNILCARPWQPHVSKYLTYFPQRPLLEGIDGVYVINLRRRPDRLHGFLQRSNVDPDSIHIFSAFDKRELAWSQSLRRLFAGNRFHSRRAVIAKALSHFTLWRHIATSEQQYHLILEDDVQLAHDFVARWNAQIQHAFPSDADVVFLGGLSSGNRAYYSQASTLRRVSRHFNLHEPTTLFHADWDPELDQGDATTPTRAFHYRPCAYILSSRAAQSLVQLVSKKGFRYSPDIMLLKAMRQWDQVYALHPLAANEPPVDFTMAHGRDSDVEFDLAVLPEPQTEPTIERASPEPVADPSVAIPSQAEPASAKTEPSIAAPPVPPSLQSASDAAEPAETSSTSMFSADLQSSAWPVTSGQVTLSFIGLQSDEERRAAFEANLRQAGISMFWHVGTDGSSLMMDKLFERNVVAVPLTSRQRGDVGRTLSHMLLHEKLHKLPASNGEIVAHAVFEDDAILPPNFPTLLERALERLGRSDWDLFSFHCAAACTKPPTSSAYPVPAPRAECNISPMAYLVNSKAVGRLFQYLLPIRRDLSQTLINEQFLQEFKVFCAGHDLQLEFNSRFPSIRTSKNVKM